MRFRPACLFLSLLVLANLATAQDLPPRDSQAIRVLQQSLGAMGGKISARSVDVRLEGTIAAPDPSRTGTGLFVAKVRGRDFSFETTRVGDTTAYRVFKGAGSIRARDKTKRLPPPNTQELTFDLIPTLSAWTDFENERVAVHPLETEILEGVPCLRIRVEGSRPSASANSPSDDRTTEVLIDPSTGLVAAIRYRAPQGPYVNDRVAIENRFSDYRNFDGVLLPTKITRYLNGVPGAILVIQSVRFNNGFSDTDFQN
jgi:hypothetical protein